MRATSEVCIILPWLQSTHTRAGACSRPEAHGDKIVRFRGGQTIPSVCTQCVRSSPMPKASNPLTGLLASSPASARYIAASPSSSMVTCDFPLPPLCKEAPPFSYPSAPRTRLAGAVFTSVLASRVSSGKFITPEPPLYELSDYMVINCAFAARVHCVSVSYCPTEPPRSVQWSSCAWLVPPTTCYHAATKQPSRALAGSTVPPLRGELSKGLTLS